MYTKLTQHHLETLSPTVEKMDSLSPGESILISVPPASLRKVRELLYSYLRQEKKKVLFKISKVGTGQLLIQRRDTISIKFASDPDILSTLPASLSSTFETHLLPIQDEETMILKAQNLRDSGTITNQELLLLTSEWQRIYQGTI
jgi:hypothetical protein